jgi:Protein of unknown function (DUF3352)
MKRLASLIAVVAALAAAGCGSDSSSSPLEEGLGYLPKDAPFAVSIDTNVNGSQYKSIGKILDKFPFGGQLRQSLETRLRESSKVNFNGDIKPILGNPFVVGGVNARSVTDDRDDNEFVGSLKAKDKDKLVSLVKKQGAKETGDENGAKLYKDKDGDTFAIKDDVLVVAGSKKLLDDALARRDGDNHLDQDTFDKSLEGLPKDALLRVYADVAGLLRSDPNTKDAQRIKWISSLTTLGATLQATDDALNVDFNLKTKPGLSAGDLPVAEGDTAPGVVERNGEVGFGLRDPAQLIKFAQSAGQAVNPAGFGQYSAGKRQIEQRYGVNLDSDVIDQLTGDAASTTSVAGKTTARIQVKDPAAFSKTLKKLAPALPDLISNGGGKATLTKPKGGLYGITLSNGRRFVFGVVGKMFVVANDAAGARRFASEPATDIGDAKGAAVMKADAEQVANAALARLGPQLGLGGAFGSRLFTTPLGELKGSLSSSTSGLSGNLSLGLD